MRIGGLASGMDIDHLVKQLMQAEKMPFDKLTQKKIWTEWQQEAYRETNLALSNLRTSAGALRFSSAFNAYSATTSNPAAVSATTSSSSVNGTYQVEVVSVANSAKMHSANAITNDTGTPAKSTDKIGPDATGTVRVVSGNSSIEIEITENMSFADVARKLQDSTAGSVPELRASFDNTTSRFFISTKGMGEAQNFSLEFSNEALANKIVNNNNEISFSTDTGQAFASGATSGQVSFDGIVIGGLTTNQTTVNGLTLNMVQVGSSTITVKSDPTKPLDAIKSFITQYNTAIEDIENKLIQKRYPDFQPLTNEQKSAMSEKEVDLWEEKSRSGLLRNDPILNNAVQSLRRAFMDPVGGIPAGNINTLSQIGISTGSYTNGAKLFIDENKLNDALTKKPDEVMALFTNRTGGLGIGERAYQELNSAIKNLSNRAGNPSSLIDNSSMAKRIKQMDTEINKWQDRLIRVEDRYWKQFTAMEKALNQMNQQSVWMQQNMFGGM